MAKLPPSAPSVPPRVHGRARGRGSHPSSVALPRPCRQDGAGGSLGARAPPRTPAPAPPALGSRSGVPKRDGWAGALPFPSLLPARRLLLAAARRSSRKLPLVSVC